MTNTPRATPEEVEAYNEILNGFRAAETKQQLELVYIAMKDPFGIVEKASDTFMINHLRAAYKYYRDFVIPLKLAGKWINYQAPTPQASVA